MFNVGKVTESCDFKKFLFNVNGSDESRIKSMESTLGFLMHGYKNLSFCPAVILNDEVISDNPEGGTGKGLLMSALSKMKKVVTIDGKSFTFERSFAYQLVSADTQILVFDDVKKHFDFERLFSVVTEGLTLEKKNKDAIKIPFAKSPKIAITTNYAIKGSGNSFARRKWELELHQYYNKNFTPQDEFGKLLFGDWNDDDWSQFDNYMINCLKSYLVTGLVKTKSINSNVRDLSQATSHEFIEWVGLVDNDDKTTTIPTNVRLYKNELFNSFIEDYPFYGGKGKEGLSRTKFYRWINSYAKFRSELTYDEDRDHIGRWIMFKEI